MKHCIMCDQDRQNEEVSLVQVLPATWNGFHNFAEVCVECQGSRRFQVWARSIASTKKAASARAGAGTSQPAEPPNGGPATDSPPPAATFQVTHRQTGAVLHTVDGSSLAGANLSGAALSGASLQNAAMRGADLHRADLHLANLVGADLRGADLRGVNLGGADLRGADLREARLQRADLSPSVYDAETQWPTGFDPATSGAGKAPRSR